MFVMFGSDRRPGEGFGDWVERTGFEALREGTTAEITA
jgi:hypothetical protein